MSYETGYAARKRASSDRRDSTVESLALAARKREVDEEIAAEVEARFPSVSEFDAEFGTDEVAEALRVLAALQAVRYFEAWPDSYPEPTPEERALAEGDDR